MALPVRSSSLKAEQDSFLRSNGKSSIGSSPRRTSGKAMLKSFVATTRSEAAMIAPPPARAAPRARVTTICGNVLILTRMSATNFGIFRAFSSESAASFKSSPPQKFLPSAFRRTVRSFEFALISSRTPVNRSSKSSDRALLRSGRFNVNEAKSSKSSKRIGAVMSVK